MPKKCDMGVLLEYVYYNIEVVFVLVDSCVMNLKTPRVRHPPERGYIPLQVRYYIPTVYHGL